MNNKNKYYKILAIIIALIIIAMLIIHIFNTTNIGG